MTDIKEMMQEAKAELEPVIKTFKSSFFLRTFFYKDVEKLQKALELIETTEMYASLHEQGVVNAIYNTGETFSATLDGKGRKDN